MKSWKALARKIQDKTPKAEQPSVAPEASKTQDPLKVRASNVRGLEGTSNVTPLIVPISSVMGHQDLLKSSVYAPISSFHGPYSTKPYPFKRNPTPLALRGI